MTDQSLRGKCEEYARAAVDADSSLTLVRGWYHDPLWGSQEHWWTVRPDGAIHDPTAAQFPVPGVTEWYEESDGTFPCEHCGRRVPEDEMYDRCCSGTCYGRMVGLL